jgi:transposase
MVPRMEETKGSGRPQKMPWVRPLLDFSPAGMTDGVWHYGAVVPIGLLPLSTLVERRWVSLKGESCEVADP